jgi:ankyrin repeat protein
MDEKPPIRSVFMAHLTDSQETQFFDAVRAGDLLRVEALAKQIGPSVFEAWQDGEAETLTPLMVAAEEGHVAIVEFLLAAANPMAREPSTGETSLMKAASCGHLECFEAIARRCDPTDLRAADDQDNNVLIHAVRGGNVELVRLVASFASPTEINARGQTALMFAARAPNPGVLRAVMEALPEDEWSAALHATSKHGETALIYAARSGSEENVAALLPHSDPDHFAKDGANALVEAIESKSFSCAAMLVDATDPRATNAVGETTLELAVKTFDSDEAYVQILDRLAQAAGPHACEKVIGRALGGDYKNSQWSNVQPLDSPIMRARARTLDTLGAHCPMATARTIVERFERRHTPLALARVEQEELTEVMRAAAAGSVAAPASRGTPNIALKAGRETRLMAAAAWQDVAAVKAELSRLGTQASAGFEGLPRRATATDRERHVAAEVANHVRFADARGDTALMKAASQGRAESVALLSGLSDLAAKNDIGLTAMGCAALAGQTECLRHLANTGQKTTSAQADPYLATAIDVFQCLNAFAASPESLPNALRTRGATPEGLSAGLDYCLASARQTESSAALRFEAMAAIGPERLPRCRGLEEQAQLAAEAACDSALAARAAGVSRAIALARPDRPMGASLATPPVPQFADTPRQPPAAAQPTPAPRRAMRL